MFIDLDTPCLPACFGSPSSLTLPFCCNPGAQVIQPCGWVISHSSPILQLDVCLRPSLAWCGRASTVCFNSETSPSSESDSRGWLGFLAGFGKYSSIPLVPPHESLGDTCWPDGWTGGQQAFLYTAVSKLALSGAVGMKPGNSVVLQIAPMILFLQSVIAKGY